MDAQRLPGLCQVRQACLHLPACPPVLRLVLQTWSLRLAHAVLGAGSCIRTLAGSGPWADWRVPGAGKASMAGSEKDSSDKDSPARRASGINGMRNSMHRQKSAGSEGELNGQPPDTSSHEVQPVWLSPFIPTAGTQSWDLQSCGPDQHLKPAWPGVSLLTGPRAHEPGSIAQPGMHIGNRSDTEPHSWLVPGRHQTVK